MLRFNLQGLLTPAENIYTSISEFEETFVKSVYTPGRRQLFINYINYSSELKDQCGGIGITQWIDGSFVTKKQEPHDIDLVTFIDFSIAEMFEDTLSEFKYPRSEIMFGVDAYLVKTYPPGHRLYKVYLSDRAYWINHFGKTKRNRVGNKSSKGFLEIKF